MDMIIILQLVIIVGIAVTLRAVYLKGRYDERREDTRPGQATFDAGSDCDEGLRGCREANNLHREVKRISSSDDSEI